MVVFTGCYAYTPHLLEFDRRRPGHALRVMPALEEWNQIVCPMQCGAWSQRLIGHPDVAFREYLLRGIQQGFQIGFRYGECTCTCASANMQSAVVRPRVIDDYLEKEVRGPLVGDSFHKVHVNRFGPVPKNRQPGKWRWIVDLSYPRGASVNDGVERELCSMKYTSVDVAVKKVLVLGKGALLAKFDVEGAYRTVPVHPEDRWLLGMRWKDQLHVDKVLPFGLRSASKIYTAVADGLQWVMREASVDVIHYLDDFLVADRPSSEHCKHALEKALALCRELGVSVAAHKTEGPTTCLVFLGIELDTSQMVVRLPDSKLRRLQAEIQKWGARKVCTKRELLSLIGQLQHACCVVKPGRSEG